MMHVSACRGNFRTHGTQVHAKQETPMTITVNTQNVTAPAPVVLELNDASGAHVELTVLVGNLPPMRHAFAFTEGTVTLPLDGLKKGNHKSTLIVHAFKHKHSVNRMFKVSLSVNGGVAATASGNIPAARNNDVGFGDFVITV
jgi:hypothetical protein